MGQVQRVNHRARRRAMVGVVIAAVLGVLILFLFESQRDALSAWLTVGGPEELRRKWLAVVAVFCMLMIPIVVLGVWLWRLGGRVVRERRFPPSAMTVVREVRVVSGDAAVWRGRLLRFIAAILMLAVAALPLTMAWVVLVLL